MTPGPGRRRRAAEAPPTGPESLVGLDVEVRTVGGGVHRGRLLAVGREWVSLERHTTGRIELIARSALTAILDEQRVPVGERKDR